MVNLWSPEFSPLKGFLDYSKLSSKYVSKLTPGDRTYIKRLVRIAKSNMKQIVV